MNSLGQKIRDLREKKGVLLRQLAAFAEVDTALISKLERGERRATREQVLKIAEYLEIQQNELIKLWLADKVADSIEGESNSVEVLKYVLKQLEKK
jgi:HTH-type transcriptional regulator, competence development regulator